MIAKSAKALLFARIGCGPGLSVAALPYRLLAQQQQLVRLGVVPGLQAVEVNAAG